MGNDPVNFVDPDGRDLTSAQKKLIQRTAEDWSNSKVPYVFGGNTKSGADCSGSVSSIFNQSGIDLGRLNSQGFKKGPFQPVSDTPQIGDVGVYPGHVVIFGGNTGKGKDVWSASHTGGPVFGPADSTWYGKPKWYRYFPPTSK